MSALAGRPIARMNGAGNQILVMDLRGSGLSVSPDEARAIHRAPQLHYDQLMVIDDPRSVGTDAFVWIFNNDGSQSGACGNGVRCVAWRMLGHGRNEPKAVVSLETTAGKLECRRIDTWRYCVDMGAPHLDWRDIPLRDPVADTRAVAICLDPRERGGLGSPSAVSMGNPHAVFFVADSNAYDLAMLGPKIEGDAMFPQRANVSVAQVLAPDHIRLKVWERGVGLTLACGSAACATVVAAVRLGLAGRRARVSLPGGDLDIEWRASDDHVLMTGPVELEFETRLDASVFSPQAA